MMDIYQLQGQDYFLFGSGITSISTSIALKSCLLPNSGEQVTMAMFGPIGYATIEPETRREENISFTGISVLPNGTTTLTGVTRGLAFKNPFTVEAGLAVSHLGGTTIRFTNSAQFYENLYANKTRAQDILNVWTFPSNAGLYRPVIASDTNALLATELITKGEVARLLSSSYVSPSVASTSSSSTGTSTASFLSWAHTSFGTDTCLVVSVVTQQDVTVTGVTFNGDALTQAASETRVTGNLRAEVWYRVAPDIGTYAINVAVSGPAYITAGGLTLEQVNQTVPIDALGAGANGSSTSPADSTTTVTDNALLVEIVGTSNDPTAFTATAPSAIQWSKLSAANRLAANSVQGTTAFGAYSSSYTISPSTDWVIQSVAFKGVVNSGAGTGLVQTVTDDGNGVVGVDNADPINPVVTFPVTPPAYDGVVVYDDTTNLPRIAQLDGLVYNSGTNTLSSGVAPVNPAVLSFAFDDFIGGSMEGTTYATNQSYGDLGWVTFDANAVVTRVTSTASNPGIIQIVNNNANSSGIFLGYAGAVAGTSLSPFGTPNRTTEFLVKVGNAAKTFFVGLTENTLGSGLYLSNTAKLGIASDGTNWTGISASGAANNQTVTTVPVTTAWTKLTIVTDGTGANAEFFVDGVSLGSVAILGTSGSCSPSVQTKDTSTIQVDYFYHAQNLSR